MTTESTSFNKLTSCGPATSVPSSTSASAFSPAVKSSGGSKLSASSSASSSSLGNFSAEVLSKSSNSSKSPALEQAQALAAAQLYEMRLSELLASGIPPPGLTPAEAASFGLFGGGFEQLPLAHSALMSHYASSLGGLGGMPLGGPLIGGAIPSPPTLPPSCPTSPASVATPTNKHGERDK